MNMLALIRLIIAVVVAAILIDVVWEGVTIIPITVYMPWWGFLITLVVMFLILEFIVVRVLKYVGGR